MEVRVDPVLLGVISGAVFAGFELGLVHFSRWPSPSYEFGALVASASNRFATGLLIPNADIGIPLWASGLAIGMLLALPIAAISRNIVGPVGLGAVGGVTIAAIAELTV